MKIIAQTDINWGHARYKPGDTLEVPDELGATWCKRGAAKPADKPLDKPKAVSRSAPRPVTPEK